MGQPKQYRWYFNAHSTLKFEYDDGGTVFVDGGIHSQHPLKLEWTHLYLIVQQEFM